MEQHEAILLGKRIKIQIRRSTRSRSVRLSVKAGGQVVISAPLWVSDDRLRIFIDQKQAWLLKAVEKMQAVRTRSPKQARADYLAQREDARAFVRHRLEYYRHVYGYSHGRVSIRDQKTRWGSCARNGNLSFNYRIVNLPLPQADYIIAHELCHRVEFNHSPKFWKLVSRAVPNFKKIRAELRRHNSFSTD